MRLRRQLLLFGLGTTAVFALLSVVALVLLQTVTLPTVRDNLKRKTAMSIESLAALDVALVTDDTEEIASKAAELASDKEFRYVHIETVHGVVLHSQGTRPAIAATLPDGTIRQTGGLALGVRDIIFEGLPLGRVELAYSTSAIDTLRTWIRVVSTTTLLFVLASILVSVKFSSAIVSPINGMVEFTKEVKKGNLTGRVPQHEGASEMRLLAHHLNVMTRAIHQRDMALAKQQSKLEANLQTIHETREQLLSSTRLAAVGEMAGRTAHEVLNPVASMHGRLVRISETRLQAKSDELDIVQEILGCWSDDFTSGGFEGLVASLREPCADDPEKPLFCEDLENLQYFARRIDAENTELEGDLAFLLKEIDRITHIVDGMRSMTRTSGTPGDHRVDALLSESVDILLDGFKKRNIVADIDCSADLVVRVDRYELIQVITNLMRNSMLAIEEDRGRDGGRVSLRATTENGVAKIFVADDGPGIADEHKPFLFESNFTTRGSSDGTGLGLAIARRLVRAVEGELTLEKSQLGVGTVFRIELPLSLATVTTPEEDSHVAA